MQDPDLFLALLQPHRDRLVVVGRNLLRRKSEAEDAVQDAVLGAWRDFAHYRDGGSFGAWVMKYLVNTIRNRNRLLREELEVPLPPELPGPETLLAWESAYEDFFRAPEALLAAIDETLSGAIAALSEAERLVLLLRCVGELSYREISEALGMPEGTAMSHLSRARKRLRLQLTGTLRGVRDSERWAADP